MATAMARWWLAKKITGGGSGEPREAMEPPTVMVSSTADRIANKKRKSNNNFRFIFAVAFTVPWPVAVDKRTSQNRSTERVDHEKSPAFSGKAGPILAIRAGIDG
jgi:hypothetical protein